MIHEINNFADFNEAVASAQKKVAASPGTNWVLKLEEVKRPRNYSFHRKLFGLIKFAYENTELQTTVYNGEEIKQSAGTFRGILIVRSGFYTPDVVNNKVRLIPDSLSYDKCSQSKAEKIFNAMLDVVAKDLSDSGYTREKLEELSEEWRKFT